MLTPSNYPEKPKDGPLNQLWDGPVRDLVSLPAPDLSEGAKERHRLYSLLVLALIWAYWNGNKKGATGDYPWRVKQKNPNGTYLGGDYLGHNIACVGVDGDGRVIDFDFNHNYVFDSTVEHAESRLVRRIFGLVHLHDGWMTRDLSVPLPTKPKATFLSDVTIYTSLESCSQCSGMMALGTVKEVVFLQSDPGQFSIGNILRNLGVRAKDQNPYLPPNPIPGDLIDFAYFQRLNDGFAKFSTQVAAKPFYRPTTGDADVSPSITSYLCTDEVRDIAQAAANDLEKMTPAEMKYPNYKPAKNPPAAPANPVPAVPSSSPLTNAEVLDHVRRFLSYAASLGRRGTPHRL